MVQTVRVSAQPAFVIRSQAYRESSLLLELFTRDYGRIGLIARGARRPRAAQRALLQPFRPLSIAWQAKSDLGTLTGVEPDGTALALVGDALYCGWYVNELMLYTVMRGDPHEALFEDYARVLQQLQSGDLQVSLRAYELRLLQSLGYGLELPETLLPEARYRYDWEVGPVALEANAETAGYSGAGLIALREERLELPRHLLEAKHLLRASLRRILGDRELRSVKAIQQMRQQELTHQTSSKP